MLLTTLLALAAAAGTALSSPVATPALNDTDAGAVYRRRTRNVYRCDGENWVHNCRLITNPTICHDRVTSLGSYGPDKGLVCTMFANHGCSGGRTATISYPGVANIQNWERHERFNIGSGKCRWTI